MEYTTVTEAPGVRITREAASMLLTRYAFAAGFCAGQDVLELACGPGVGLGYLAQRARRVVGADCTESFVRAARRHYREKIEIVRLDAQALPFSDRSFDVIVFFEAIYYLAQPRSFLKECHRALRPGGTLLICTVNPEWPGFHPSPFSTHYFHARELREFLATGHLDPELFGAFPGVAPSRGQHAVLRVRNLAVRLGWIPRTMKGKELLKRVFYGGLVPLSRELQDGFAELAPLVRLNGGSSGEAYKVLYAAARKRASPC